MERVQYEELLARHWEMPVPGMLRFHPQPPPLTVGWHPPMQYTVGPVELREFWVLARERWPSLTAAAEEAIWFPIGSVESERARGMCFGFPGDPPPGGDTFIPLGLVHAAYKRMVTDFRTRLEEEPTREWVIIGRNSTVHPELFA
jgi:hypothetical protein